MRLRMVSRADLVSGMHALLLRRCLFAFSPPVAKGLFWKRAQIANGGPVAEHSGKMPDPSLRDERPLTDLTKALCGFKPATTQKNTCHSFHANGFEVGSVLLLAYYASSEMDENLGNIDLDRADFVAGSAQRRRIGKRLRVLHVKELRREYCTDGTRVNGAIGVASCLPIDRTGVETSAAADAVQRLSRFRVGEDA